MTSKLIQSALTFQAIMKEWLGEGGRPVDRATSQSRADTCLKCPKHNASRPLVEALETAVAMAVKRQLETKSKMALRVEGEKRLHLCGICNCVLQLKVHVPIAHVAATMEAEILKELPAECWQVTEMQAAQL